MKGTVLDYSISANEGFISGDDQQRYQFSGSEWRSPEPPTRGMRVDFEVRGPSAVGVFRDVSAPVPGTAPASQNGNKIAAGICAILLGALGIHKFILGMTKPGLIMILVTVLTCGWGGIVMWIIGVIEGILYLTKSDEEFERVYVVGKKEWF